MKLGTKALCADPSPLRNDGCISAQVRGRMMWEKRIARTDIVGEWVVSVLVDGEVISGCKRSFGSL